MIKYDYEITVNGNQAKLNKDIYLFRGNKNVHYYFAVKNASFNFKGSTDLIEKTNAINAAVTVIKPNNVEVASAIAKVENGKIHLKVTEDLIDEEVEVGDFDLVFDLFDDTDGAVTIPKVIGQFHVLERPCTTPISELVATNTTNEVDQALTDYAIVTYAEPVASTNADGTFAKKTWVAKEKITTAELNRMEEGISDVSSQCKDIAKKTIVENNKLYLVKEDGTKIDEGTTLPSNGGSTNINSIKMSIPKIVGTVFEKPDDKKYVGWALGNTEYDNSEDTINVLVNACNTHSGAGESVNLYLLKMNAKTLDYTLTGIFVDDKITNQMSTDTVNFPTGGCYTYGFCIDNKGDYIFMPNYKNGVYLFRSTDKGATWSVTQPTMSETPKDYAFTGLMQTSTGRLIVSTHSSYFWYSDDNGITFTKCSTPTSHVNGHEATIVELKENELIAVMRKRWQSTDNGAWTGNRQIDPAYICYSHDNGETWTQGVDSTTITEMSASGCAIAVHKDEGTVELYATSRYPHGDKYGVIIQHYATIEDAMNDNWSTGKIIAYSQAKSYDDFGYPSCCVDNLGNTHLFYYDGDSDVSGFTNYYYIQCIRNVDNFPLVSDKLTNPSLFIPYSAKETKRLLDVLEGKLNARINEILAGGGSIIDPDDGSSYIMNGVVANWDFNTTKNYNENFENIDTVNKNVMQISTQWDEYSKPNNLESILDDYGIHNCSMRCFSDLTNKIVDNKWSIEMVVYTKVSPRRTTILISIMGGESYYPTTLSPSVNAAFINYKYNTTSGTIIDGTTSDFDTPVINKYTHIVFTSNGENFKYYVNGNLITTIDGHGVNDFSSLYYDSNLFKYGLYFADNFCHNSIRVYSKELTQEEINNNYKYEKNKFNF